MVKRDACFRRIVAKITFYELFSRQPVVWEKHQYLCACDRAYVVPEPLKPCDLPLAVAKLPSV